MDGKIVILDEKEEYLEKEVSEVFPDFKIMVYRYHTEPYEGDGELVVKTKDDKYFIKDIGHCSCYGACDYGYSSGETIADHKNDLFSNLKEIKSSKEWREEFKEVFDKLLDYPHPTR